jgi:DtxR family transcriptional regulator, Mn-dependent transcriptional regulator
MPSTAADRSPATGADVIGPTSATLEEYLEAIFKLSEDGAVRPGRLAAELGVAAPTVTATLKRLESRALIERKDGDVVLTEAGRREAVSIVRRHRISERFLVDVLDMPWDEVHEEACRLEHALSPRVLEALEQLLEMPQYCPHGHPIPAPDGTVVAQPGEPLSSCSIGTEVRILRIDHEGDELLGYLSTLGMFPGERVQVCEIAPFQGPLLVRVGEAQYALGREVASKIIVRPIGATAGAQC